MAEHSAGRGFGHGLRAPGRGTSDHNRPRIHGAPDPSQTLLALTSRRYFVVCALLSALGLSLAAAWGLARRRACATHGAHRTPDSPRSRARVSAPPPPHAHTHLYHTHPHQACVGRAQGATERSLVGGRREGRARAREPRRPEAEPARSSLKPFECVSSIFLPSMLANDGTHGPLVCVVSV